MISPQTPWMPKSQHSSSTPFTAASISGQAKMQSAQPQLKQHSAKLASAGNRLRRADENADSSASENEEDEDEREQRLKREGLDKVFYPRSMPRIVSGGTVNNISPVSARSPDVESRAAKEAVTRQLIENGFPSVMIKRETLGSFESRRSINEVVEELKSYFASYKFTPSQVGFPSP